MAYDLTNRADVKRLMHDALDWLDLRADRWRRGGYTDEEAGDTPDFIVPADYTGHMCWAGVASMLSQLPASHIERAFTRLISRDLSPCSLNDNYSTSVATLREKAILIMGERDA